VALPTSWHPVPDSDGFTIWLLLLYHSEVSSSLQSGRWNLFLGVLSETITTVRSVTVAFPRRFPIFPVHGIVLLVFNSVRFR